VKLPDEADIDASGLRRLSGAPASDHHTHALSGSGHTAVASVASTKCGKAVGATSISAQGSC
jgi:hypothetical protein